MKRTIDVFGLPERKSIAIVEFIKARGEGRKSFVTLKTPINGRFEQDAIYALLLEQGGTYVCDPDYLKHLETAEDDIDSSIEPEHSYRILDILSVNLEVIHGIENNFWQDTTGARSDIPIFPFSERRPYTPRSERN